MTMAKQTKAEQEQFIRDMMASNIYWSIRAFKSGVMTMAIADCRTATEISNLVADDRFVEVAQEQCEIQGIDYEEWFKTCSYGYIEALHTVL